MLLLVIWPRSVAVDHIGDTNKMIASRQAAPDRVIECEVTAYTSTDADCGKHDGITATGSKAGPGTVAADWHTLPPGTRLEIPGYGPAVVADRGGGITNDRLDVWMHDEQSARKFGRKKLQVRILP
jgi:3D (Asp-Asp-Asp) domain-containing protein